MTEQENALNLFKEELGELAQEMLALQNQISKAMRFGIDEKRDLPTTNRERIESEWNDLLGSLCKLSQHGIDLTPNLKLISDKVKKIDKYTAYSISLGTVQKERKVPSHTIFGDDRLSIDSALSGNNSMDKFMQVFSDIFKALIIIMLAFAFGAHLYNIL